MSGGRQGAPIKTLRELCPRCTIIISDRKAAGRSSDDGRQLVISGARSDVLIATGRLNHYLPEGERVRPYGRVDASTLKHNQ